VKRDDDIEGRRRRSDIDRRGRRRRDVDWSRGVDGRRRINNDGRRHFINFLMVLVPPVPVMVLPIPLVVIIVVMGEGWADGHDANDD
jgi:hypothetical protein